MHSRAESVPVNFYLPALLTARQIEVEPGQLDEVYSVGSIVNIIDYHYYSHLILTEASIYYEILKAGCLLGPISTVHAGFCR